MARAGGGGTSRAAPDTLQTVLDDFKLGIGSPGKPKAGTPDRLVEDLLAGYAAALSQVRTADTLTRGLVVDVLEGSARSAMQTIGTREPGRPDLRARVDTYANDLKQDNTYKSARGIAFDLAKIAHNSGATNALILFFVGGGLVSVLGTIGDDLQEAGRAGGSSLRLNLPRLVPMLIGSGVLAAIAKGLSNAVDTSFAATNPARSILAGTIDGPEQRLYDRWSLQRPGRASLEGTGLAIGYGTLLLIGLGLAVVAFVVFNYAAGALAPPLLPQYDPSLPSLFPTPRPLFSFAP